MSYSCTDREFRPADHHAVRWLDWERDLEAAQDIWPEQHPLTRDIWQTARRDRYQYCGAFTGGRLVACAAVWMYCERAWEVAAVRTRPEYRRHGYGKSVVSFVTSHILGKGRLATWLTAETNTAMRRTAESVGFYQAPRPQWADVAR